MIKLFAKFFKATHGTKIVAFSFQFSDNGVFL